LRNKQIDELRKRREVNGLDVSCIAATKPYDLSGFMDLIKRLPDNRRELLFFRYVSGYSLKELTEIYGVALGTVKSRLNRACEALKC